MIKIRQRALSLKRTVISNKYKKRDGKEGDQKARTDTDQKSRQWNKDKPRGERKFNKGDVRFRNKTEGPKSEKDGNIK